MSDTTVNAQNLETCGPLLRGYESLLRHRQPFLFVGNAEIDEETNSARCDYRFDEDSWFFRGHFPDEPIVPGVLILEMAAQTANTVLSARCQRPVKAYLVSVQNASFKAATGPGETVEAHARLVSAQADRTSFAIGDFLRFKVNVRRGKTVCMRGEITLCVAE